MAKKLRDSQRSKVYAMDKQLGLAIGVDIHKGTLSMDEINEITKRVFQQFGLGRAPKIKDGRGCRFARGCDTHIVIPKWARNRGVLAHELARVVAWISKEVFDRCAIECGVESFSTDLHGGKYLVFDRG